MNCTSCMNCALRRIAAPASRRVFIRPRLGAARFHQVALKRDAIPIQLISPFQRAKVEPFIHTFLMLFAKPFLRKGLPPEAHSSVSASAASPSNGVTIAVLTIAAPSFRRITITPAAMREYTGISRIGVRMIVP